MNEFNQDKKDDIKDNENDIAKEYNEENDIGEQYNEENVINSIEYVSAHREKRKKQVNLPEGDDGRVIAPMNVDGMPWYNKDYEKNKEKINKQPPLTREESRLIMSSVVKGVLVICGIFTIAALIFIAFCVFIWFK
ncbi:MAG: hypothetical protein RR307_02625 [Clostridia bacterium]